MKCIYKNLGTLIFFSVSPHTNQHEIYVIIVVVLYESGWKGLFPWRNFR